MRYPLRRWLLARIIHSALVFEKQAIEVYRGLEREAEPQGLQSGIRHLLEEEELHLRILHQAANGELDPEELERLLRTHVAESVPVAEFLSVGLSDKLKAVREKEKETYVFYTNLRRISKIPVVRKAFEVLADMEKEHVQILGRLLAGRVTEPTEAPRNADRPTG